MILMTETEAENFLEKEKFPIISRKLTKNYEEAKKYAQKIGFPVVLKIASPELVHKTEKNAVILNVTKESLKNTYQKLDNIKIKKQGILVQKQIQGKTLILGIKKDPVFKHIIMIGFGGILSELIKDISIRLAPINKKEAEKMINELKLSPLITGFRGKKLCKEKIINLLVNLSNLPKKYPAILELDINPLIVSEKSATIVDARIIFEKI